MKKTFKFEERDGHLAILGVRLGQAVNPRLYSGIKRKIFEWIVNRYFIREDKR